MGGMSFGIQNISRKCMWFISEQADEWGWVWTYPECHGATFTQDPGQLWPHFLIIEPMRGLGYITRTQFSKPNPNKNRA